MTTASVAAEYLDDRALLLQLHAMLTEIDPVRWRDEAAASLKVRARELHRRLAQRERLAALAGELDENLNQLEGRHTELKSRWLEFKKQLLPAYESMAARFRADKIHVPSVRPTNWARSAFHLLSGALAVLVLEVISSPGLIIAIITACCAFVWSCEIGRRVSPGINRLLMKAFRPVAHELETYRINSATWYSTALLALALTRSTVICVVAVTILALGDPMAGFIGRRFGSIKLVHGRSLQGTLAFFISGSLAAFALLVALHPSVTTGEALALSLVAALFGAVAELVSAKVDDNLSVPLAAGLGAGLVLLLA